jgi:hypothetical protein
MTAAYKRLMRDDEQLSEKGKVFRGELLAALKRYGITGLKVNQLGRGNPPPNIVRVHHGKSIKSPSTF